MEIIYLNKGRGRGRISVARTLATMEAGETWATTTDKVDYDYVRMACSKLSRVLKRDFSVAHTREMGSNITIKRLS